MGQTCVTHTTSGVDHLIKSSLKSDKKDFCNFRMSFVQFISLADIPLFLPLI